MKTPDNYTEILRDELRKMWRAYHEDGAGITPNPFTGAVEGGEWPYDFPYPSPRCMATWLGWSCSRPPGHDGDCENAPVEAFL